MYESLADLEKNIGELRKRLYTLLQKEPQSIAQLAKVIGIHEVTLGKFLKGTHVPKPVIALKIQKYVAKKEKDIGHML